MPKIHIITAMMIASLGLSACGGSDDGGGGKTNIKPNAIISPSSTTISIGQPISLSGKDSSDDGEIVSYLWNSEENSQSGEITSFTFTSTGEKEISLTVTDDGGLTDKTNIKITVIADEVNPVAKISGNSFEAIVGQDTIFSAASSSSASGSITSYLWQLNGNTIGTEKVLTHAFSSIGDATLKLTVTDSNKLTNTTEKNVSVKAAGSNINPVANITGYDGKTIKTGSTVNLSGSTSTDDNTLTQFSWSIGASNYSTEEISHTFTTAGTYTVTLTVTDSDNASNESSITITVADSLDDTKPVANFTPALDQNIAKGSSISFDGSNSSDAEGDVTYLWSTGETTATMSKTFNANEEICLTVTDSSKQSAEKCISITVTTPATSTIVYFQNTNNFTTPTIHYWNVDNLNADPGVDETTWDASPALTLADGEWYTYDFGKFIDEAMLIFHEGNNQTGDLTFKKDKPCYQGSWVSMEECGYNADPNIDKTAPQVKASPAAGIYIDEQKITLTITDEKDSSPKLYFTTDGSKATTSSDLYTSQVFEAKDINDQVDLRINVLAVDASGNEQDYSFNYRIGQQVAGSGDFREENVYFLMTDRFVDGDTNNNDIWGDEYLPDGQSKYFNDGDTDLSKTGRLTYYHGGDFQGIVDNLDYLQDLGFTAIWITPAVKQMEGRYVYDDSYHASPFHGYWAYDFDQIDPHLHSSGKDNDGWDDFDKLVDALHNRGMKLMLDIVANHGHPQKMAETARLINIKDEIIMDGQTWVWETQDPYYDAQGNGFYNYNEAGNSSLAGLIDFGVMGDPSKNATQHLINVYKRFIDHGADAFRIDTVAYMPPDFWETFTKAMDKHARSLGNDNFYMCGEAWTGDRSEAVRIIYNGGGDDKVFNMLDMHGSSIENPGWMGNAFKGEKGFDDENGYARIAGPEGDASGIYDPTYLATFVDNHDKARVNAILTKEQYMNNLNFIYLTRGLPIVYYGTELLYSDWPHYVTSNVQDDVSSRWMLGKEGIKYVKDNQPTLAKHLKMLNTLRRSSPALQKGQQSDILMEGNHAVFKRDLGGIVAYVAMSIGDDGFSHDLSGLADGNYRLITPDTANASYNEETVTVSGGSYNLSAGANSFVVLEKI